MRKLYLSILTILLVFSGVQCTKDETDIADPDSKLLLTRAKDLLYGDNYKYIKIGETVAIPLNLKGEVPIDISCLKTNREGEFEVEWVIRDGRTFLEIRKTSNTDEFCYAKIHLSIPDTRLYKQFTLIHHPMTASAGLPLAAEVLGKGIDYAQSINAICERVYNYNVIAEYINMDRSSTAYAIQFSDQKYNETCSQITKSFGVGTTIPGRQKLGGLRCSISADLSTSTQEFNKSYFEYNVIYARKHLFFASVNPDALLDVEPALLLDSVLNNVLNNPSSKQYKQYANTKQGIFDLLTRYGTHIITRGSFGGTHRYVYAREENQYGYSSSRSAVASMSASVPKGGTGTPASFLQVYLNKLSAYQLNLSGSVSDFESEVQGVTRSFSAVQSSGGEGAIDIDVWDSKVSNDNAVLIGFARPNTQDSESDGGLIPLYELISKDSPERLAAMEKYFDDYFDYRAPVMKPAARTIVVDFRMRYEEGKQKGQRVMTGPDGKKRLYNVLYGNSHVEEEDRWLPMNTAENPYIHVIQRGAHNWYYALGHSDEDIGITDIIFATKSNTYVKSGSKCSEGIPSTWSETSTYLKLGPDPKKGAVDTTALITAVGLAKDKKKVFAASAGTEMENKGSDRVAYDYYWIKGPFTSAGSTFYGNLSVEWAIYPAYSKQYVPPVKNRDLYVKDH